MERSHYILILILIFCTSIGFDHPDAFSAEQDQKLNDIIEGFDDDEINQTEDLEEDEILEGFEEETEPRESSIKEERYLPPFLNLDGYFKIRAVYGMWDHDAQGTNTQWQGLNQLRTELKLELDADLPESWQARISGHAFYDWAYTINGRNNYTDEVLDQYEKEIEFDEVWLLGSLTRELDLKSGRQIVVWGRSDNIRITDVLNPLDLRLPGLTDIEKLRLPVTMTKFDYFFSALSFSGMVIHEIRYNKNPVFGSDFFPAPTPLPGRTSNEGLTIEDTQFAASFNGIFRGWDASLYGAYIFDDFAYFRPSSAGPPPRLTEEHARIKMLGAAGNAAWGNWLLKTEFAYFDDLKFTNTPGEKYARLEVLAGFEYAGFSDTNLTVEIANAHLFDFDNRLKDSPDFQKENLFQSAIRLTQTYLNDTLMLTALATTFGVVGEEGAFQRFTAEYDYTDAIQITGGVVFYQSGDLRRTKGIGDNDRVYLEVKYNF
jgi:hypothetical protein